MSGHRVVNRAGGIGVAVAVMVALVLAACGGGGGFPSDAVVQVDGNAITKSTLEHWMAALANQDYAEKFGGPPPAGLVTPVTCLSDLKTIVASPGVHPTSATPAMLADKCKRLRLMVMQQALTYLIYQQWLTGEAKVAGITVRPEEERRFIARVKAEQFPTEAGLRTFLTDRRWTLSDELASLRGLLLQQKLLLKLERTHAYGDADTKKWTAMTDCRVGYVVEQCRQWTPADAPSPGPSGSVLLEQIRALESQVRNPLGGEDQICEDGPGGKGYICKVNPRDHGAPSSGR